MKPDRAIGLFQRRVQRLRAEQGLTYADLGAKSGITTASLFKILSREGVQGPGLVSMARIASGLGVTLAVLLAEPGCETCDGAPPPGFTCSQCGTAATEGPAS